MDSMTSKERVKRTFAHQEADRVPIDYSANEGIHNRLMEYYGLGKGDNEGLYRVLGVDFRCIDVPYTGPKIHIDVEGRTVHPLWGYRTRWIEHQSGGYWDYCDFPLKDADEAEVAAWPMPSPNDFDYSRIEEACSRYKDLALYVGGPGLGDIINQTGMVRTMEQTLVDLMTDESAGLLYIDRRIDVLVEKTRRIIEAAKNKIDFLWMGEDLGTQIAPLISPELFRKHIRPRHQKIVDMAKSFGLPVMIHSCGSSSWAFNDFIEMGIDAVDTLQPEAANMNPEYLKKSFGDRLVFHGCISTAGPLAYGTVADVTEDVRKTLEIMMPGGGYCLAPTHKIQDNSPTENVVTMYASAHKYGHY